MSTVALLPAAFPTTPWNGHDLHALLFTHLEDTHGAAHKTDSSMIIVSTGWFN